MTTKEKGNFTRHDTSCAATSRWCASPVPVSPITAKRTEPFLSGSFRSSACIAGGPTSSNRARTNRRRMGPSWHLSDGILHVINNQVRIDVAQDQVLIDDAVLDLLRQRCQVDQEVGRHGWQRLAVWVRRVHFERHSRRRVVFDDLLGVAA